MPRALTLLDGSHAVDQHLGREAVQTVGCTIPRVPQTVRAGEREGRRKVSKAWVGLGGGTRVLDGGVAGVRRGRSRLDLDLGGEGRSEVLGREIAV